MALWHDRITTHNAFDINVQNDRIDAKSTSNMSCDMLKSYAQSLHDTYVQNVLGMTPLLFKWLFLKLCSIMSCTLIESSQSMCKFVVSSLSHWLNYQFVVFVVITIFVPDLVLPCVFSQCPNPGLYDLHVPSSSQAVIISWYSFGFEVSCALCFLWQRLDI